MGTGAVEIQTLCTPLRSRSPSLISVGLVLWVPPIPSFFWFLSELYKEIRIIINILGAAIENMHVHKRKGFSTTATPIYSTLV